jgi:methionyl-tRNA formyltransferase
MNKCHIVYCGNNEKTLQTLLKCDVEIDAYIYEAEHDLPHSGQYDQGIISRGKKVFKIPKDNQAELLKVLKKLDEPDFLLIHVFTILSLEALEFPKLGCMNIHPSLLPEYKGAHPIKWALINGEREIGVTFMKLDTGIDTGGIYRQVRIDVTDEDDYFSLSEKVDNQVEQLLPEVLQEVFQGNLQAEPQRPGGSYFPKLTAEIRYLNFRKMTARNIHNLTRSQVKYGGSITTFKQKRITFHSSRILEEDLPGNAGEILRLKNKTEQGLSVVVQTIRGKVELFTKDEKVYRLTKGDKLGT